MELLTVSLASVAHIKTVSEWVVDQTQGNTNTNLYWYVTIMYIPIRSPLVASKLLFNILMA